jgi:hypothetical protein
VTDVPQGYLPPHDAYQPLVPVGANPDDPLVNPYFAGLNGWFHRVTETFKRSWRSMAAIFAITYLVPNLVLTVAGAAAQFLFLSEFLRDLPNQQTRYESNPDLVAKLGASIIVVILIAAVAVILLYLVELAGYAAATFAVTREAAGQRVSLGEALAYGFRRAPGLFGWQFLSGLLVVLGFVACILPGFYMIAALALVGPIYLFERRNPIGRSFSIFNNNLGRVLGRLALLLCAMIAAGILNGIIGVFGSAVTGGFGNTTLDLNATVISSTVTSILGVIIELPLTMIIFTGILLTYAEQRGYEGPVNSATLAAEL